MHLVFSKVRVVAAAVGLLVTGAAQAVIVYSGPVNLTIPNTTVGLYLNVLDGTSYTGPGTFPVVPGPGANYDFNVYGTSAWTLFSPGTSGQSNTVPTTSRGYVSATTGGAALNLALGTLIGPASVFNTGLPSASALTTGTPAIVGFRFRNEGADLASTADDTVHFGWARLSLVAGSPGTLIDYAFESTPLTPIAAGVVPEPATWLMMGLGAAALVARRRRVAR